MALRDDIQLAYDRATRDRHEAAHDVKELQARQERAAIGAERAQQARIEAIKAAHAIGFELVDNPMRMLTEGKLNDSWAAPRPEAV